MAEYNLGKVVGTDGNGIVSITKTDTTDNVDTYTIEFSNGNTTTFTVTNGRDGSGIDVVTAWEQTLSDEKVASEKLVKNTLDSKLSGSDIIDNLTSTASNKALSANQGKVLYDLIAGIEEDMLQ